MNYECSESNLFSIRYKVGKTHKKSIIIPSRGITDHDMNAKHERLVKCSFSSTRQNVKPQPNQYFQVQSSQARLVEEFIPSTRQNEKPGPNIYFQITIITSKCLYHSIHSASSSSHHKHFYYHFYNQHALF